MRGVGMVHEVMVKERNAACSDETHGWLVDVASVLARAQNINGIFPAFFQATTDRSADLEETGSSRFLSAEVTLTSFQLFPFDLVQPRIYSATAVLRE